MIKIGCYYACECGLHHFTVFRFKNSHALGKWLLIEYSNIDFSGVLMEFTVSGVN